MKDSLKKFFTPAHLKAFGTNLLVDCIGSFFFAIGVYNFAAQADFAPGGVTGIAIIINHYTDWPIGLCTLVINLPIILLALRILGKRYLLRTFQTVVINTVFLDVISPRLPVYTGNPLLASLFAGAIAAIGLAIIYNNKSCTGGSDLIIMSVRKKRPHMSVGQITIFVDGIIVLVGGFVFRKVDAVLYGFIYSAVMTMVIDKIMFGVVSGKLAMIISTKGDEITAAIGQQLQRGTTRVEGEGGYSKTTRDVILCACRRSEAPMMKKLVHDVDPSALMIMTSYDEVYGEGFLPIDD